MMAHKNSYYMNAFTRIEIDRHTGDPALDKALRLFRRETLNLLKDLRERYRIGEKVLSSFRGIMQMGAQDEPTRITADLLDRGIRYDFQESKEVSRFFCYMDYQVLETVVSPACYWLSTPREEADSMDYEHSEEGMLQTLDQDDASSDMFVNQSMAFFNEIMDGEELPEELAVRYGMTEDSEQDIGETIRWFQSHQPIYRYLKKLGILVEAELDDEYGVDYSNVLVCAARAYAAKLGTEALRVKSLINIGPKLTIVSTDDTEPDAENWKKERLVTREELFENPKKRWYTTVRDIALDPYLPNDDDTVQVSLNDKELAVVMEDVCLNGERMKKLFPILDRFCQAVYANFKIADERGELGDEMPVAYMPYVYLDENETLPFNNLMLVSEESELLEIPILAKQGVGEMLLTQY